MIATYLVLASAFLAVGVYGVLARRNLLVILMSVEVILNAGALAMVAFARGGTVAAEPSQDGQIYVLLSMAVAAAEAGLGLAILVLFFRNRRSADTAAATSLSG